MKIGDTIRLKVNCQDTSDRSNVKYIPAGSVGKILSVRGREKNWRLFTVSFVNYGDLLFYEQDVDIEIIPHIDILIQKLSDSGYGWISKEDLKRLITIVVDNTPKI